MAEQEEYDIRKIGPLKYKQLQEANRGNYSSEAAWNIKKIRDEHPIVSAYDPDWMTEKQVQSSLYRNSGGKDYWGKSMFDDPNADINEFSRLGDIRAENQPWYAQLGAGLGKMTVLAGTTFVEGTLGLLWGAGTAIAEGRWSGLWDNEITRAMQAINEASEEWMPNYYTEAEQTGPLYKQLGTMNFWADKFIKNLGFSIGAAYGVAALKIPKLVSLLGAGAKTTKATTLLTSGFVSAVSEGSIEAVNNTNDWEKLKVQELDDDYRANIDRRFAPQETALAQEYQKAYEEYHATKGQLVKRGTGDMASYVDPAAEKYEQKVAAIDAKRAKLEMAKQLAFENRHSDEIYTSARDKISEDKEHMGNMDLLANIPILTISNIVELGKFYARGLNTARRSGVKVVEEGAEGVREAATKTATRTSAAAATELEHTAEKEAGKAAVRGASRAGGKAMPKFEGKKMSKGRLTYNITKGALAEGTQEISQKAASVITGDYYSTDVNNFYKSKLDPDAEKETLSWMKSIMRGMNKTVNDSSSWEEFFIGALTGAVGVPMFKSTRAADGSKRSPITLEGGAINHYLDAKHDVERSQEIAAYLNNRVQDPNFLNYYRSFIRRAKTQKEMDSALARDDVFDFKNAEYAQFVSDIIMFDSAGKLGMLEDFIGEALDLSDENLENIVRITTRSETDASGKVSQVSPFQGMLDTKEGKEEMRQILTKAEKKMRDTMNKYRKTATNLDTLTNGILNDEQLSELTYLQMQSEEWSERGLEMAPVVKKAINDIIKNIEVEASSLPQKLADAALSPNGSLNEITSIGESHREMGMTPQRLETLKELAAMKDEDLARVLSSPNNADFARSLAAQLAMVGSDIISNLDRKNVLKMLMDYPRIGKAQQLYNDKIKEYLERPEKLQEDQEKATEEIVEQTKEGKKQDLRTKLTNAKSVHEFREALNTEDDDEVKRTTLAELEQENNPMAKNYKETTQFDKDIQVQLSNMGLGNQVYNDALALWRNQVGETENLNQMANESSVHLGDDTFFLEDSANDPTVAQTRFQNARYAVQQAMQKVKEDIKYRDRFSPRYETPEGTPAPTRGVTGTTTGDSGVSTVPPTNPTVAPAEASSVPVGNISSDEVAEENKELNEILADTEETESNSGPRQYWKPQIPELHIKATKDGDFRDFDIVVKEREGKDFSVIYSYLKSNVAFEYLNSGRLKAGDTLGFMIDPLFEEQMSQYDWYEGPTIFFVHGEQVVGDVASLSQAARFEGLTELINKVRAEYQASKQDKSTGTTTETLYTRPNFFNEERGWDRQNDFTERVYDNKPSYTGEGGQLQGLLTLVKYAIKYNIISAKYLSSIGTNKSGGLYIHKDAYQELINELQSKGFNTPRQLAEHKVSTPDRFYATPKTKVAKMMVGKIEHGSQERSLNDIPGVMDSNDAPIFGIVKNGRLEVNGKVDPRLILTPNDMSNKEGRLYLLIPNGAGTYSPIAVRVKHFNNREFNLNDETVASTEVGKMITAAIEQLANCTNEDDFKEALNALTSVLYKGNLHINWFNGKTGYGIRFTKAEVDSNGEEIYITNEKGERVRKETSIPVFLSSKTDTQGNISVATIGRSGVVEEAEETRVDPETAKKQITNVLLKFNLPIQVRADRINTPGYNERIIESNVTTSNTVSARSRSTWFVTNPIGPDGKLKDAVPPKSVAPKPTPPSAPSPVGGNESVVNGTTVSINGVSYTVDLQKMTYVDEKGVQYAQTKDNLNIFAMAWAEKQYGSATEGYNMTDNKVITPQGRVLDRNTGRFLPDSEAQKVKDKIANRGKVADNNAIADKVVADIYENQKKVDKSRTDDTFYYILEEDGEYHKYPRVHTRIGDNWIGPRSDSTERNSKRSLKAGSAVDQIIRDFFSKKTPVRPDNMSEAAFNALIDSLNQVKETMEKNGETFMADNIVLFYKYPDGTRVAGEVDILSRTKDGNFKIYDVKTSSRSFHDSSFTTKSKYQRMSTKDYYTLQLSGYQNLFHSQYGIKPTELALFPFVLTYDTVNGDTVTSITKEKGIIITYNPNVNVPLAESPTAPQQPSTEVSTDTTPLIFKSPDSTIKVEDRENDFHKIEGGRVGYYEAENGKVYKGYLKEIGNVDGIPVYMTKEAITTDSYGMAEEHVVMNSYLAVFPSGKAVSVLNKVPVTGESAITDEQAGKRIFDVISQYYKEDPEYVQELAQSETSLSKNQATSSTPAPSAQPAPAAETKSEIKPETKPTTPAEPSGAQKAVQAEKNINKRAAKRMKPKLREKDSISRKVWNKEKELSWLRKVLPQLSEQDRVKLINGLIQVSENGPYAWGMFDEGIITLSDIAAEGTTYHEAFHVVFNLMLSPQEREALFEEARQRFGNKDIISLEEDMAEEFREYVMTQEDRGLGRKILDFFKNLFAKVTNWKYVKPSLNSYYRMINQGKYSRDKLGMTDQRRARQEEYTPEMQAIKDRAIANGTFMKINGKPTNLTERQWLQVRTKAFKNWFGDWENNPSEASKVVDENGEPLVVYHSSPEYNITVFRNTDSTSFIRYPNETIEEAINRYKELGYEISSEQIDNIRKNNYDIFENPIILTKPNGIYAASNRKVSETYITRESYEEGLYLDGEVYPVFLNIRDNNIIEGNNSNWNEIQYKGKTVSTRELETEFRGIKDGVIIKNIFDFGSPVMDTHKTNLSDIFIVFNPNQIKSATSNNGDFSTTNDDIRYRIVPTEEQAKIDETAKAMRKEAQSFLDNFGITFREAQEFGEGRLFNAIDRVINIRNADDISEGVGQAIAFMMQHNGLMQELFRYKLAVEDTVGAKSIRRSLTKRGNVTKLPSVTKLEPKVRERLINEVGQDIATQLRKLYNVEPISVESKSFLSKLWELITEFFSKLTPEARTKFNIIKNYTANIANSVKLNDPSIIRTSNVKPGTNVQAARVDIAKALRENPYERKIIEFLSSKGIALAGSASIALEGTLYRPDNNPLHDIDFNAPSYTKESLDTLIKDNFPNVSFIREIQDGPNKITETYLTMDREYTTKDIVVRVEKDGKVEDKKAVGLYDKKGEQLGYYIGSDLILKEGVKGKFLDFFLGDGNNVYPPRVLTINNKPYLIASSKNAFRAKVTWQRPKDIWDYNRFIPAEMFDKIRKQNKEELKRKVQNARIIWGHPAIGKTTYLERNDDIIEWDAEVNAKRDAFFREQLDPEHKLDIESREYKNLKSEYMETWQSHPEYINFLIKEWTALKKKAEKENKRIFASPAPLMVLFEDDFDLFVALPEKVFLERNKERGGKHLSSMGWKQIINKNLVLVDPNKVVYTEKYFSEFIRDTLGVQWGTLTNEEVTALEAKGWTEEMFKRVSQQERDNAVECIAL